jgi:hypothetical protein
MVNELMNDWKGCGIKQPWPVLRNYPEFSWRDRRKQ